jgi:hypothetical protein
MGLYCGDNVSPLTCLPYTNPGAFDFKIDVDYVSAFVGNAVAQDILCYYWSQGCVLEGIDYRLGSVVLMSNEGVTWNRYALNTGTNTGAPLFFATWAVGSLEGSPVAIETFPLRQGEAGHVQVYLRPEAVAGSIQWSSERIVIIPPRDAPSWIIPAQGVILFTTAETSSSTVTTRGTFRVWNAVLGSLVIQGTTR